MKKIKITESELVKIVKRVISESDFLDFEAEPIMVMVINLENFKSKKLMFTNYDVEGDILILFNDGENETEVIFENGEFRDSYAPNMFIYKPMNDAARRVFSEIR